jgi:hypothetical protein
MTTASSACPTIDTASQLGILSEVADGRIRVWGPLSEVKRWWALAGCDLRHDGRGAGVPAGEDPKVDSWTVYIAGEPVGYIASMIEVQPMVRDGDLDRWCSSMARAAAGAPRGRMAYSFTAR